MKINFLIVILYCLIPLFTSAQSISEKEIFNLKYKGSADSYNLRYDEGSGNYCYVYLIPGENKSFIISKNTLSDKYDYIVTEDIKFDSKGNYYAIVSDYKPGYGTNNYFLIVNGKEVRNSNYMESYNSYVNKKGEFVFIFKEKDSYFIGYYNLSSGFRQSEPYENIKAAFSYKENSNQMEGEAMPYNDDDFYHNEKGERAFIATINGKVKIIFETSEIATDYSDINESSLTQNKNNELSYIAKKGGRFYELYGNEFVVSGKREYDKFDMANVPLLFNEMNEPVYIAGDSVAEDKNNFYVVLGNQIQNAYTDKFKTVKAPEFTSYITEVRINGNGKISYLGNTEIKIPDENISTGENSYDKYFMRTFFVNDEIANELGYNVNRIVHNENGDMLYSGIADLEKNEMLLMLNYGISKIIINKQKFDGIYDYGFSPRNEVYYAGQTYEVQELYQEYESSLYLGDKLLDKSYFFVSQTEGDSASILKFNSTGDYAFVTEKKLDSVNSECIIYTNSGRLPFPENVSGSRKFIYVSNLMYIDNKLFYVGDMKNDPVTYTVTKEIFYNNKSLGKTYNVIDDLDYDDEKNQITFTGSSGNKIYLVTVRL